MYRDLGGYRYPKNELLGHEMDTVTFEDILRAIFGENPDDYDYWKERARKASNLRDPKRGTESGTTPINGGDAVNGPCKTECNKMTDNKVIEKKTDTTKENGLRYLGAYDVHRDLTQDGPRYIIDICHAPFTKDEISLEIIDGVIDIRFSHDSETAKKTEGIETLRRGLTFSNYFSMGIPVNSIVKEGEEVALDKIKANCTDGILHIYIPIIKQAAPRSFKIKLG